MGEGGFVSLSLFRRMEKMWTCFALGCGDVLFVWWNIKVVVWTNTRIRVNWSNHMPL